MRLRTCYRGGVAIACVVWPRGAFIGRDTRSMWILADAWPPKCVNMWETLDVGGMAIARIQLCVLCSVCSGVSRAGCNNIFLHSHRDFTEG